MVSCGVGAELLQGDFPVRGEGVDTGAVDDTERGAVRVEPLQRRLLDGKHIDLPWKPVGAIWRREDVVLCEALEVRDDTCVGRRRPERIHLDGVARVKVTVDAVIQRDTVLRTKLIAVEADVSAAPTVKHLGHTRVPVLGWLQRMERIVDDVGLGGRTLVDLGKVGFELRIVFRSGPVREAKHFLNVRKLSSVPHVDELLESGHVAWDRKRELHSTVVGG
mmetsp:Transcript_22914/g.54153  ORF Transcript_22914/g.54153 Transcript_22914/m.54153 type:complete len:220 (+) Transcript_22914:266-925(+)